MVYSTALEMRPPARDRGFKSHPLRRVEDVRTYLRMCKKRPTSSKEAGLEPYSFKNLIRRFDHDNDFGGVVASFGAVIVLHVVADTM